MPASPLRVEELPIEDDDGWLVLIGEGSDSDATLRFLQDLWPDVEGDGH
jgi:hypothetical protein